MQNTNIVTTYDYYTLDQARQIIAEENKQKAIRKAERKARKRAEAIYYIKQKLSGLTMAAIGIITPILLDGDATFSLIALPLGIWLIFTKEKVFTFSDTYTFNSDYTEEEVIIYIKHDLKLVAGGGYNTDHIHNVKFEIEKF